MSKRHWLLGVVLAAMLCGGLTRAAEQQAVSAGDIDEADVAGVPAARAGLVLTQALAEGAVEDGLAKLRLTLDAQSYSDGEQRVLLLPADVAVSDWSVKKSLFGPKAYVRRSDRGVEFVMVGDGTCRLHLDFVLGVAEQKSVRAVILPIVPAVVSTTRLRVPGTDLEFSTDPKATVETRALADATIVTVYGGEGTVALSWKPKVPEKVLEAVVFASQAMRLRLGEGLVRIDTAIDYTIVQGSLSGLEVRYPADCALLNIEGADIRTWDVSEPQGAAPRTLKVSLMDDVEGHYRLTVSLEKVLPELRAEFDLSAIEPLGVVREKGQVAVMAVKGISVEAVSLANISHVDVREMTVLPGMARQDVRLGFRYLKRPWSPRLRTGEVVAKTSVETLTTVRAGMDTMRLLSDLNYTVRDAGVFQFRVRLDEGLKLIDINGANINNWQMDEAGRVLTVALRSKAEGRYRLQIETEMDKPAGEGAAVPAVQALEVDRATGYLAIIPAPGMKVETASLSGISQIDVKELPDELLKLSPALAYRHIRPGYGLAINVTEIQPEVHAEVQTVAILDEHELNLDTEIHYSIRRAGIFQLRVAIPKELRRTNIEGPDIDDTSWDEEQGILTVNLRSKVTGAYVLKIETEKTLAEIGESMEVPVISTAGVRKERGFLAVVTRASVRLKAAEGKLVGLDDVAVSDLPPQMLRRAGEVAMAFKYFAQPWGLAFAVERIDPRVTAEVFNLISVGEKLVTISATVQYRILHAGVDRFVVKLPPDAEAVDIDGDAIKRREEGKDEEKGIWTVTLQSKRTGSYTLYVSFEHELAEDQAVFPYGGLQV